MRKQFKMAESEVQLIEELSKFQKKELIDLIVYKKLPVTKVMSESVKKLAKIYTCKCLEDNENDDFVNASDEIPCDNGDLSCNKRTCFQMKIEHQGLEWKVTTLDKMVHHLESQINVQNDLIIMLKGNQNKPIVSKMAVYNNNDKNKKHTHAAQPVQTGSTSYNSYQQDGNAIKTSKNKTIDGINRTNNTQKCVKDKQPNITAVLTKNINKDVTNKNTQLNINTVRKNNVVRGTGNETTSFQVAEAFCNLFVSGFAPNTTEENLKTFLNSHQKANYQCELLTTSNKNVNSFKISVPQITKKDFLNAELWPQGIIVNNFFRKKIGMTKKK